MDDRQSKIFITIVREYIKTAIPISSQQVLDISKLNLSSATVRNEMVVLEENGLIEQPHTSAGRIPTQKGYSFYVSNYLSPIKLNTKYINALCEIVQKNENIKYKVLAKALSQLSGLLVFVAFDSFDIYYTGLSHLLSQPEFVNYEKVYGMSKVVDHIDEVISQIYKKINEDIKIYIGNESPFSQETSSIITSFIEDNSLSGKDKKIVLGLIGPTRMDYDKNFSLIKQSKEIFNLK